MDAASHPPPLRRRSSVAYDPARDTFTEIPDSVPEHAVLASPQPPPKPAPTQTQPRQGDAANKREADSVEQDPTQVATEEPNLKRRRPSPSRPRSPLSSSSLRPSPRPTPTSAHDLHKFPKRPREEVEVHTSRPPSSAYARRPDDRDSRRPRRSRSPPRRDRFRDRDIYSRRSPPRRRTPPRDPSPIRRSPSPIRRSPPRQNLHRPGGREGRGRNVQDQLDRARREREARQNQNHPPPSNRGVQDVSNQFYNQRPEWVKEKGRDWRKNESQIKGLRSFNNWIKSVMIQKFSPEDKEDEEELAWGQEPKPKEVQKPLRILDIGCGKGGDLGKWDKLPTPLELYVGLDPAETSIQQAGQRYGEMGKGRRGRPFFDGRFYVKDCFGQSIEDVGIVRQVGFDPSVGNGMISRFGGGGFDVVTMMFSMHYAFESEEKVRTMLKNVAGSLKKGGRFIGVVPNSDALAENIKKWFDMKQTKSEPNGQTNGEAKAEDGETADEAPTWGNTIYNVRFPPPIEPFALKPTAADDAGSSSSSIQFRPPFGWKYTYWMAEAVDVPEFVVPWEAFRAIAESYNLEQRYRKGFLQVWEEEKHHRDMWELAGRMGVIDVRRGEEKTTDPADPSVSMVMTEDEKEAVAFYHAFCFVKV